MLKPPQEKILSFIRGYLDKHQMPPSLREIQDHCGFSAIGTIQYHMKKLAEAGYIDVKSRLSRGIQLTDRAIGIPILGTVPAGPAQLAFENIEGYITNLMDEPRPAPKLPAGATKVSVSSSSSSSHAATNTIGDNRGLFALRVKGDSMINAGILDGDLVIVHPQNSAKSGDIVVARIAQEEATVKRLIRKPGLIHLAPENPKYRPIPVDESTEIIGKVVRVVRHYAA
jgi:repressor LexA